MLGLFGGRVEIAGVFRHHLCLFCGFLIVLDGYGPSPGTRKSQGIVTWASPTPHTHRHLAPWFPGPRGKTQVPRVVLGNITEAGGLCQGPERGPWFSVNTQVLKRGVPCGHGVWHYPVKSPKGAKRRLSTSLEPWHQPGQKSKKPRPKPITAHTGLRNKGSLLVHVTESLEP